MKLKKLLHRIMKNFNSIRYKLLIMCLLPTIVLSVTSIFIIKFYSKFYYNEIINMQKSSIKSISSLINNSIYEVLQSTYLISDNENVSDILYYVKSSSELPQYKISNSMDVFTKFLNSREIIEDVFIYNRSADYIVSSKTAGNADNFFSNIKRYEAYDLNFWKNYSPKSTYAILRPTTLYNYLQSETNVYPLVCNGIGDVHNQNLFVINLKTESIEATMNEDKPTLNSEIYIIDEHGFTFFSTSKAKKDNTVFTDSLLYELKENKENIFEHYVDGKKYAFFAYTPEIAYFNGLTIVAQVSIADIARSDRMMQACLILSIILVFIICSSFILINVKNIYNPVKKILDIVRNQHNKNDSEFDFLTNKFKMLIDENTQLTNELNVLMPQVCEQYLVKALKSNYDFCHEDIKKYLKSNNIILDLNYFQFAIFSMNVKKSFIENFSEYEQKKILSDIREVLSTLFSTKISVYIVELEKYQFGIICNMSEDSDGANIEIFNRLNDLFAPDYDLLDVYIGVGCVHKEFSGLKQSYEEARNAFSTINQYGNDRLKYYDGNNRSMGYTFPLITEHKLVNCLLAGKSTETLNLLETIFRKNSENNLPADDLKNLCIRLKITGDDVIAQKKIDITAIMGEKYTNLENMISYMTVNEVIDIIFSYYKVILGYTVKRRTKIDINQIVDYINNNYHKDIYLQSIAELFDTSDKYISKVIKESLGISFQQYLSIVRITKAKELLQKSNYNVKEISKMVGFNNQNTFLRMFQKLEGLTPTEYKKTYHK